MDTLKKVIEESDDCNIIFLGDFVYHFSYDRDGISMLFQYIVGLVNS